jgi:hypothetical protein
VGAWVNSAPYSERFHPPLTAPGLPEGSSRLQLRGVAYLGARIDIDYDADTLSVTVQASTPASAATTHWRPYASASWHHLPVSSPRLTVYPSAEPLAVRSQKGRVVLRGGVIVNQQALVLVDAAGGAHALAPGVPVQLPLQAVAIVAAAGQ